MIAFRLFGLALLSGSMLAQVGLAADRAPLQIIVSKDQQNLVVYEGDQPIAQSRVSTGKPGHSTPSGIFSIIEKQEFHRSNLYSNAPMPWMQRITWSGLALHESNSVPNYPASHGCVRLPAKFAKALYSRTTAGYHVIITDAPVQPMRLENANMLTPRMGDENGGFLSDANIRTPFAATDGNPIEVASNEVLPKLGAAARVVFDSDRSPIRMLITRPTPKDIKRNASRILDSAGFDTTADFEGAIKGFQQANNLPVDGKFTSDFISALYKLTGHGTPPNGQLLVRRDFKPLLDSPVMIADPEVALGTHFIEAWNVKRRAGKADWFSVTLDNEIPESTKKRLGITVDLNNQFADNTSDVINRIQIPDDIRLRLETLLADGSSMTITDYSHQQETGENTDFITITKPGQSG